MQDSCLFSPEISNTVGARWAPVFLSIDDLSNLFSIQIPVLSRYFRYYVFHCLSNLLDPFWFRVSAPLLLLLLLSLLLLLLCPFLVDSGRIFGLVYSPWERATTSHHGSQVSLLLLLTGTVLSLVSSRPQQCCFLDNFQPHVHADSLHVLLKVDWYGSRGPNNNRHYNDFSHAPDLQFHLSIVGISLTSQVPYLSPCHHLGWPINYENLSLLVINKDNVSFSCLNFPITLDDEIPQYLEVFTFHHSLRPLFIPAISSFQSTFTTKLPVDIQCHAIMPSFIFCLRPLTALSHHMGHCFSLTSTHSAQGGFCWKINMKSRIINLVPGRYISGPQYILSNLLLQSTAKFYPSQYLPFLSYTDHAFFSASIHSLSPLLHSLCTSLGPQPLRCWLQCYLQLSWVMPLHYFSRTN